MRQAVVTGAVLAAAMIFTCPCQAQSASSNDPDEARIEDLITASHILANEGILDSFGHVSARSAKNPDHFFMPRAMPPALVSRADIVEVGPRLQAGRCRTRRGSTASAISIARSTRRAGRPVRDPYA